jgi:hypothetical protein
VAHAPTIPGITPVAWTTGAEDLTATQPLSPLYLHEKATTEPEVTKLRQAAVGDFPEEPSQGYWHHVLELISERGQERYRNEYDAARTAALHRAGKRTVTDNYILGIESAMDSATVLTAVRRSTATDRPVPDAIADIENFTRLTLYEGLAAQTARPAVADPILKNATALTRELVRLQVPGFDVDKAGFSVLRQHALYFKAALAIDERGRLTSNFDLTTLVRGMYYAVREVQLLRMHAASQAFARPA